MASGSSPGFRFSRNWIPLARLPFLRCFIATATTAACSCESSSGHSAGDRVLGRAPRGPADAEPLGKLAPELERLLELGAVLLARLVDEALDPGPLRLAFEDHLVRVAALEGGVPPGLAFRAAQDALAVVGDDDLGVGHARLDLVGTAGAARRLLALGEDRVLPDLSIAERRAGSHWRSGPCGTLALFENARDDGDRALVGDVHEDLQSVAVDAGIPRSLDLDAVRPAPPDRVRAHPPALPVAHVLADVPDLEGAGFGVPRDELTADDVLGIGVRVSDREAAGLQELHDLGLAREHVVRVLMPREQGVQQLAALLEPPFRRRVLRGLEPQPRNRPCLASIPPPAPQAAVRDSCAAATAAIRMKLMTRKDTSDRVTARAPSSNRDVRRGWILYPWGIRPREAPLLAAAVVKCALGSSKESTQFSPRLRESPPRPKVPHRARPRARASSGTESRASRSSTRPPSESPGRSARIGPRPTFGTPSRSSTRRTRRRPRTASSR